MAVDDEVGKACAVTCVKEPSGRCDIEEDVRCCSRRSTVVRSAYDERIGPQFLVPSKAEAIDRVFRARRGTHQVTILRIIEPGLSPELTGDLDGVDAGRLPPGLLVAGAMDRAVM